VTTISLVCAGCSADMIAAYFLDAGSNETVSLW